MMLVPNLIETIMKKYLIIAGLSVIAIVNAAYLSYKAYIFRYINPIDATSFCDISKTASCTDVLRDPLSNVFGIPFPWIALVVYPILLALAIYGYRKASFKQAKIIAVLAAGGICFNGFIIYREVMYIHVYCLLCLMCSAIIISNFVLALQMINEEKRPDPVE